MHREHPTRASLIVGVDGRPGDADALALARVLLSGIDGPVLCAHAMANVIGGRGMAQYESSVERKGRALVGAAARELGAQAELLYGENHAHALAHLAEHLSAQVLVLGSTHRGDLGRIIPGGVASQLLTRAPCAIAVAPAGYAEHSQLPVQLVGVAYDGTDESVRAAQEAATFAARVQAPLRLYHAFHQVPQGESWDVFRGHMRDFAQEIVDGGLNRVSSAVTADGRVLEGPPGVVIAEAAEADGVGLLFAGSRGYGPLHEALVGGLVGALLSNVSCPLVIFPRGAVSAESGD